jgi:hypothetical protein
MAQWGIAMSYFHGLWGEFHALQGRAAVDNAQKLAAANSAATGLEKAYIEAISQAYRDEAMKKAQADNNKPDTRGYNSPDHASELAYAEKMSALHAAYPDDDEAAIFNALALDIASDPRDKTHAGELARDRILEPLFNRASYDAQRTRFNSFRYQKELLDHWIDVTRQQNLHLVLLWFGSWRGDLLTDQVFPRQ